MVVGKLDTATPAVVARFNFRTDKKTATIADIFDTAEEPIVVEKSWLDQVEVQTYTPGPYQGSGYHRYPQYPVTGSGQGSQAAGGSNSWGQARFDQRNQSSSNLNSQGGFRGLPNYSLDHEGGVRSVGTDWDFLGENGLTDYTNLSPSDRNALGVSTTATSQREDLTKKYPASLWGEDVNKCISHCCDYLQDLAYDLPLLEDVGYFLVGQLGRQQCNALTGKWEIAEVEMKTAIQLVGVEEYAIAAYKDIFTQIKGVAMFEEVLLDLINQLPSRVLSTIGVNLQMAAPVTTPAVETGTNYGITGFADPGAEYDYLEAMYGEDVADSHGNIMTYSHELNGVDFVLEHLVHYFSTLLSAQERLKLMGSDAPINARARLTRAQLRKYEEGVAEAYFEILEESQELEGCDEALLDVIRSMVDLMTPAAQKEVMAA